jgi:hypothetical protein
VFAVGCLRRLTGPLRHPDIAQPGNEHFRLMIDANLERYRRAQTKKQKSIIVSSIVRSVRSSQQMVGRFIRKQDNQWFETGDDFAREKVGQW